ncbi:MAG: Rab family GTPase [Candidatus Hodarchaeota archaeon]
MQLSLTDGNGMASNYDFVWKFIFGGAGGAGKTTFLNRFMYGEFSPDTKLTVGVQFKSVELMRKQKKIGLLLWDLGGQERFRFIQGEYMKNSNAAFVFFDMTRPHSQIQVPDWVTMYRKFTSPQIPIVLVGAKFDLCTQEEVDMMTKVGNDYVKDLGLWGYVATSAKTGTNIAESIYYMVDLMLYRIKTYQQKYE